MVGGFVSKRIVSLREVLMVAVVPLTLIGVFMTALAAVPCLARPVFTEPFELPAFTGVMRASAVKKAERLALPFLRGADAAARLSDAELVVPVSMTSSAASMRAGG